jgi:hypothetical protein
MSNIKSRLKVPPPAPFMADFVPFSQLWNGASAPYPSEHSARWALRKLQVELAQAQAVALHRNMLLVHLAKFEAVAQSAALKAFSIRAISGNCE